MHMNPNFTYTLFGVLILLIFASCGSSKYVQEIPFKLRYDDDAIARKLGITDTIASNSEKHEYEEGLTDEQIYLKEKYAISLRVLPVEITNYKFYGIIDEWIGTKYAKKGMNKDSLNIASFAQILYQDVYDVSFPPTALGIFNSKDIDLFTGRSYLEEGDIIFFRYNKDLPVSDIGIYLRNDLILASTRQNGLAVFDFNSKYFQLRYLCSGRIKQKKEN